MKKFLMSIVIVAVMAVIGLGVIVSVWATTRSAPVEVIEKPDTTPRVAVQPLEATEVRDLLYLVGVSEPWEAVTVSAEVTGKIEWQGVDDGDRATKDQELIRINTTSLQARLDQVRAEHKLALLEFDRVSELRERGISSPQEFDRASTNRDGTAAMVKVAEIEFNHSVIRSEFDGVVDRMYNETGEFVSVGKPLARLVQVDKLKVLVGIPERDVARFKTGDPVQMRFDSLPERTITGMIYRIATTAEPATRTFVTEIEVDNADGILKPGMIARVALVRALYPEAITVPMFTLISRPEGRYVFVEEGGRAVLRPVETGFFQDGRVLITKGLSAGERLVVMGQRTLSDGDTVLVAEPVGDPS
jgi:membrane fusion protein (multidrug efflux system)